VHPIADPSESFFVINPNILDDGNSSELDKQHHELHSDLPNLKVLGDAVGQSTAMFRKFVMHFSLPECARRDRSGHWEFVVAIG
jgi:hypothetical protein